MLTFTKLPEAQAHARANNIQQYWRLIRVTNNMAWAGGWLSIIHPRETFYFDFESFERACMAELRAGHRIDASTVITEQTSDSPNAR